MGGYGSGRTYSNPRPTTESYLRLDVRRLCREGFLEPGAHGTSTWTVNGRVTSSISHLAKGQDRAEALELSYRVKGEPRPVMQRVPLDWTPCNYGGERPWALCPRCSARVAVLYGGGRFYCRKCHRLAYASTRLSSTDRGIRKAQAIRVRLGGSPDLSKPFPRRPKGMHWTTYFRLEDEATEAYMVSLKDILERLDTALGHLKGSF